MRNPFAVILAAGFLVCSAGLASAQTAVTDVLFETSLGDITVALDHAHAPKTVDNFLRYVNEGHYDGTLIYRIAPGFVIQMGSYDPATKDMRPTHDPIPLEAGLLNTRGTISMARESDPNTATAEFFINLVDNPRLDRQPDDADGTTGYAVFGHVITGMDVVDKIAAVPLGPGGPMPGAFPADPVKIIKVSVITSGGSVVPNAAAPAPQAAAPATAPVPAIPQQSN
jgi:cyclophilin family peptidyl-prolyl cis-trans isomerase